MEILKGYKIASPQLGRDLHKHGLTRSIVGKILGVDRNKSQKILSGEYPISGRWLGKIEEEAQKKNPHFTLADYVFSEEDYVSERGIRLRRCRACGKYFECINPRMRYCSPACSDAKTTFKTCDSTENLESDQAPVKRSIYYDETIYEEARRRHIDYATVQKERTLAEQPSVMQRWAAYQREKMTKK